MRPYCRTDGASSHPIGVILMVALTLILGALVLLLMVQLPHIYDDSVPAIFVITNIRHVDEYGTLNYDSYMTLVNTGTTGYRNKNLYVKTYVNGNPVNARIVTLNADAFCSSVHTGVETIGGTGTKGSESSSLSKWYPDQHIWIDYSHDTFHPEDMVKIEVYDTPTQQIISRHTYRA
jgi:FlaG/FlaF family flagellin (archaellin)